MLSGLEGSPLGGICPPPHPAPPSAEHERLPTSLSEASRALHGPKGGGFPHFGLPEGLLGSSTCGSLQHLFGECLQSCRLRCQRNPAVLAALCGLSVPADGVRDLLGHPHVEGERLESVSPRVVRGYLGVFHADFADPFPQPCLPRLARSARSLEGPRRQGSDGRESGDPYRFSRCLRCPGRGRRGCRPRSRNPSSAIGSPRPATLRNRRISTAPIEWCSAVQHHGLPAQRGWPARC